MSVTLKKCPFCGGKVRLLKHKTAVNTFAYYITCEKARHIAEVYIKCSGAREIAIETWNRRAR